MGKIIIIGAGPGGYETAVEAAKNGFEVTLITDGELGGTCLNEGCIPTKSFVHSSANGISLPDAVTKTDEVISQLQKGIEFLIKSAKVTLIQGHAQFIDNKSVKVMPSGETFTADKIIIATGSEVAFLPIQGAEYCITSKEILKLTTLPQRLCIIGGGVIGLEFASIFNMFGCEVTVLEYFKQILPRFDADLAKRLKQSLTKSGIRIVTGAEVQEVRKNGEKLDVCHSGQVLEAFDVVLMAVGRKANISNLGLENTSISYSKKGIDVDANMQTSVSDVYAIGDVNARMMLAHVATFQGKRALNHIMGKTDRIRFDLVPSAVFTTPEVATIGLTEEDCTNREIAYKAYKSFYRANGKAVSMDETDGYFKLLVASEDGRILGAHIFGAHSSDIIHEIAALMNLDATIDDLQNIIHAHPTLSEIIQSAIL